MSIMNLFKPKHQRMKYKEENVNQSFNKIEVVYYNDAVTIVEACCRCCTNSKSATNYQDKATYIEKRISSKHDSILEHSNIIMFIPNELDKDIPVILTGLRYLNIVRDQNGTYIAGSVRAYKYFITHTNRDDYIPRMVLENLKNIVPRCLMKDLTDTPAFGLSEYDFPEYVGDDVLDFTDDSDLEYKSYLYTNRYNSDRIEIVNLDPFNKEIVNFNTIEYTDEEEIQLPVVSNIGLYDLLKLGTITVCFKGMSRAATHQLVRHRNAITQESQRYVNVEKNPTYVPEKYKNDKFKININNSTITTSLTSLNEILKSVYPQLISQGVVKEDARGFLPTNITCGKLYMTFTWENLIKFFKLRMDKAAQEEIRIYATELYDAVKEEFNTKFIAYGVDIDTVIETIDTWYLEPALFESYGYEELDEVEVIDEVEE